MPWTSMDHCVFLREVEEVIHVENPDNYLRYSMRPLAFGYYRLW